MAVTSALGRAFCGGPAALAMVFLVASMQVGLLTAIAMMAAGWDGAPQRHAPGFPDNGRWQVRWEGLKPMP
jgi:hypothetical protein